ncbi:MAG: hypothetical protein LLF94_03850 [Chlamydiales bacterium]|nr:hypothetical protein [Chlamydiales bacterium]
MHKSLFIIFMIIIIVGCISVSTPRNNAPFKQIDNLHQLEGVYKNRSTDGTDFLSRLIWKEAEDNISVKQHDAINTIEVRKITEDTLKVKALGHHGTILKQGQFVNGKDFKFKEGKLLIKVRWRAAVGVMVGPNFTWVALGIDTQGQGKSQVFEGGAGLVYLFVPAVGGDYSELRFEKMK